MAMRPTGPDAAVDEPKAMPMGGAPTLSDGVQTNQNTARMTTATLLASRGVDADEMLPRPETAAPGPAEPFDESALTLEPETFLMDCPQRSITVFPERMPVINHGVIVDPGCPGYDIEGHDSLYRTPTIEDATIYARNKLQSEGNLNQGSETERAAAIRHEAERLIRRIKVLLLHEHPLAKAGKIRLAAAQADDQFRAAAERLAALAEARGDGQLARAILAGLPHATAGPDRKRSVNVRPPPAFKMPGQ